MGAQRLSRREFLGFGLLAAGTLAFGAMPGCTSARSSRALDLQAALEGGEPGAFAFTDSAGRSVALPQQMGGIVPSGAYAQVILCTLCPEKLVGLSSSFSLRQAEIMPPEVTGLPVLGRYYGKNADMNYEAVIKLAPDAIVDAGEEAAGIGDDLQALQDQTGIPCFFVNATITNLPAAYRMLGEALGVSARAEQLASYVEGVLGFAKAHREEVAARNLRVMYSTGAYGYQVKAKGSLHSSAIDLLGADNVAVVEDANATEVSPEQVMIWQPDVLLLSKEMGFFDLVYDDPTWASISAVCNGRVYEVPYQPYEWLDRPPSVQTILGLQWLGNLLCPDIYDFDMVGKAQEFYRLFWGYELPDAEAQELLANSTALR